MLDMLIKKFDPERNSEFISIKPYNKKNATSGNGTMIALS